MFLSKALYRQRSAIETLLPFILNIAMVFNMVAGIACYAAGDAAKPVSANGEHTLPKTIATPDDFNEWFSFYYLHPQPQSILPAMLFADKSGVLDKTSTRGIVASFLTALLPKNPALLDELITKLKPLTINLRYLLVTVIWMSNNEAAKAKVPMLLSVLPESDQDRITRRMLAKWQPLLEQTIDTPEQLDMLWAAFSATGEDKYVERLLAALTDGEAASAQAMAASTSRGLASKMNLNRVLVFEAASWSITSNARQHKKVLEICKRVAKARTKESPALNKVIEDAEKKPATKAGDKVDSIKN